jgi:hypothetical protein
MSTTTSNGTAKKAKDSAAKKTTRTEAEGDNATSPFPMFYDRPEALNPARHGKLRLRQTAGFGFAARAHAIPVMAGEMPAAMRSYPIVFVGPQKMPVVITGVRREENLFVDGQSHWAQPHYIPAYVRRYPFILAGEDTAERLTMCVDVASERVTEGDEATTAPLFEADQPSEATRQAVAFCEQYQGMLNATRAIIARIDGHGLLATRQSKITLESGEVLNLTDFQVIDEAALNALSDEAYLDLRKSGALPMVYCHLASMNSWSSLLHQARQQAAAGA